VKDAQRTQGKNAVQKQKKALPLFRDQRANSWLVFVMEEVDLSLQDHSGSLSLWVAIWHFRNIMVVLAWVISDSIKFAMGLVNFVRGVRSLWFEKGSVPATRIRWIGTFNALVILVWIAVRWISDENKKLVKCNPYRLNMSRSEATGGHQ